MVTAELRSYAASGNPVTSADLLKRAPSLRGAIYRLFGGVPEAAAAAGVAHSCKRKWSPEAVVAALQERADSGRDMTSGAVMKEDVGLHLACGRQHGSFAKAMAAAGLQPERKQCEDAWLPDEVLRALREMAAIGKPYNAAAVQKEPGGVALYRAAGRHFGTFDAAVEAAGLPISRVHAERWTAETLIALMRERHEAGQMNTPEALRLADESSYHAMLRIFGSVDKAAIAAGLTPERKRKAWPREAVLAELRALAGRGIEMSASGIRAKNLGLYGACLRRFGTTEKALEAAGVEASIRQHAPHTCDDVIAKIAAIGDRDGDLSATAVINEHGGLYRAGQAVFGSWGAAVAAAGMSHRPRKRDPLTKEFVTERLNALAETGVVMNANSVRSKDDVLYGSMLRLFGSFDEAVRAAGLEPVRIYREWDHGSIVAAISDRHTAGLDLNMAALTREDGGLLTAATDRFGSWDDAVRAAGIDPEEVSREAEGPRWGRVFEVLSRELLLLARPEWIHVVRAENLKPDLYDRSRDACIDLKAGAWINGVDATIAAYAPFCSAVDIIYGRGRPRGDEAHVSPDGRVVPVRFVHWSTFAGTAVPVADLERLTSSRNVPSDLRGRTRWTPPPGHERIELIRKVTVVTHGEP